MSLAALGCNPNHRWTISSGVAGGDNPTSAVALGSLGYSNDGGIFVCVQASGAIGANKLISIQPGWQAIQRDSADIVHGTSLGASSDAFADDEYGWLQIFGVAALTAGAAVGAGVALQLDAAETGDVIPATAATPECLGVHAIAAIADNAVGNCQLTFPVNRA